MSNKFHRLLSDAELHRPERTGEGSPNGQSIFQPQDGQYYQDTLTGDVWRYVEASNAWELLLDYDRENNLITNAQQRYDIKTQQIGELRSNIESGSLVTSVDAYLFTQVRQGEDITVYQSGNTDNAISFTVTADNEGGDTTIAVESERAFYNFLVGDPIKLDAGLLSAYQSADPTKIYSSISEERRRISIGSLQNLIAKNASVSSIVLIRETTQTLSLRGNQFLYIYTKDGVGQFIQVDGDQTLNGSPITIAVDTFTASYAYDEDSYVVEPAWSSTTQITQTANTVTILSQTVSETSNAVASINTRTGILEANVTTLAQVDSGQNTAIATAQLTASDAYAAANLSVKYDNTGAYVKLFAGAGGSEITLAANQIDINGLITAINNEGGVETDGAVTILSDDAPTTREGGAELMIGDIWIDTNAGDKPYVWKNTGTIEEWQAAYTQIDGGNITTGTINASVVTVTNINASLINAGTLSADRIGANTITSREINVSNLFAQSIDVGNVIKSSNFDASNGFAIFSNGESYFRDVVIAGSKVNVVGSVTTIDGSNIDGKYVANINAGTINVGTLDADVIDVVNLNASLITSGTIDAGRVNTSALFTGSATVSGNVSIGTTSGAMVLGAHQAYATQEIGDGIKIDANNYWLYSTSEDLPVFRVGDTSNYVLWNQFGLQVRGTINASDITSGFMDGDRISATSIEASKLDIATLSAVTADMGNLTIDGQLTIGASGKLFYEDTQENQKVQLDKVGLLLQTGDQGTGGVLKLQDPSTTNTYTFSVDSGGFLKLETLPTSQPTGTGQLWNDGGYIRIT